MPDNLHPLIVHFPIALLLSYIALDWAGRYWKGKAFAEASWYILILGLAGTLFTVISGLLAARGVPIDSPALVTLNLHKFLGLGTFVVFGLQALCIARNHGNYSRGKQVLHTVIQITGIALIVLTGYFGGELVFTFGVGTALPLP